MSRRAPMKITDLLKTNAAPASLVFADEGRPSHTFLNGAGDSGLVEGRKNLVAKLCAPGLSDIDFEPERLRVALRDVDFI